MALAENGLAARRVVAKLPPALYVRLYTLKLKTGRSLEKLLIEAVEALIEKRAERDQTESAA